MNLSIFLQSGFFWNQISCGFLFLTEPDDRWGWHWLGGLWFPDHGGAGFTLVELLVVLTVLIILFATAIPAWQAFLGRRELQLGSEQVFQAIRQAQSQARNSRVIWQFSVRESGRQVQWATHPANRPPLTQEWQSLSPNIRIDSETTLSRNSSGVYQVQFNANGGVNGSLGRLTLSTPADQQTKRCIFVSTLLGAMRSSANQPRPQDGRWCY